MVSWIVTDRLEKLKKITSLKKRFMNVMI